MDLALRSAEGQGDLEVERVMCLRSAVTGYANFIYDLKEDTNFGDFMKLWECQKDKDLSTKLVRLLKR